MEHTTIYSLENPMPDDKFTQLFDIMERSFPKEEHGTFAMQRAEMYKPDFRCMCYEPDGIPAGFMNYYTFAGEDIVFLEHFAVAQELRGNGAGSRLMQYLKEITAPKMIVLEVEPPEGDIQRRRIAFYQRLGFYLNNGEYFQPAFYGNSSELPLKLMSTEPMDGDKFKYVSNLIRRKAYDK